MNETQNIRPPKWPLAFLKFFVRKDYLEEIEGDMEEVFQDTLEHHSLPKANRIYAWEMLKLFRPTLIKRLSGTQKLTQYGMIVSNKVQAGTLFETITQLDKVFEEFSSGLPFRFEFVDNDYQAMYQSEKRVASLSKYFAIVAIVIVNELEFKR